MLLFSNNQTRRLMTSSRLSTTLQASLNQLTQSLATTNGSNTTQHAVDPELPSAIPYTRLPSLDIIRAAADLYFRYCHNQPYSLFHEATFRQKIETGEVPTHLQFALLASTVRYSNDAFFEDKIAAVSGYAQQSWKAIAMPWNGIQTDAELSIVQTILLLAIIDYTGMYALFFSGYIILTASRWTNTRILDQSRVSNPACARFQAHGGAR